MLDPASPIYELVIGIGCLIFVIGTTISIPTMYAMYVTSKEDAERINKQ